MLTLPVVEQFKDDPRVYEAFTGIVDSINGLSRQLGVDARPSQQGLPDRINPRDRTPGLPPGRPIVERIQKVPFFNTDGRLIAKALTKAAQTFNTNIVFSSTDFDTVSWTAGTIAFDDGTSSEIKAGNTGNMSTLTYIFYDASTSSDTLQITTDIFRTQGDDIILLAIAQDDSAGAGGVAFFVPQVGVFGINGDLLSPDIINETHIADDSITTPMLKANIVTAAKIAAATITAAQIAALTITANELAANSVTASKINVATLSAISADIGAITAGTIDGLTITGGTVRSSDTGERVQLRSATQDRIEWTDTGGVIRCNMQWNQGASRFEMNNSAGPIQLTANGTDAYLFSTTSLQIASGNSLDMNNGSIGSCGNIELDSISKDGGGNVLVTSNLEMSGSTFTCEEGVPDGNKTRSWGQGGSRWANLYCGNIDFDGFMVTAGATYGWPANAGSSGEQLTTNGVSTLTWTAASSLRDVKNIVGSRLDYESALQKLVATPVYDFQYKHGKGTGDARTVYTGILAEDLPEVMHHEGRIFSEVSGFGYLLLAIKALNQKIEVLEELCRKRDLEPLEL
jgi:hypothetical protein